MNKKNTAIIVGAGIAGIAAAIRLAAKGYAVKVFDANPFPGGKLTAFTANGYRFDAGPSLFTMPQYVDELFTLAGKNPRDYFNYTKKEVVCNYFWDDGQTLTAWGNPKKFAAEAEEKGLAKATDVVDHLEYSAFLFDKTHLFFLERSLHKLGSYIDAKVLGTLAAVHKLSLLNTLDGVNKKRFSNPKMVQLFNRYATYNGSSPYLAPGVMQIIPHLEYNVGAFIPVGGMHDITTSLVKLGEELGVEFHLGERVVHVDFVGEKAAGIQTDKGNYKADVVVMNADIKPAYKNLLTKLKKPKRQLSQEPSSSALIFYWGIKKEFPQLDLHNIFFSNDYETEFDLIFKKGEVINDPTVYINITSKDVTGDAPTGCENWFVMVNVPHNSGQNWDEIIPRTRQNILQKLQKVLGEDIAALIEVEEILEPRTIESRTSSFGGALYGSSSNNMFSAFLRHPNFTRQSPNLFFCGGSVHPGGGIPLCLLSAKIVGDLAPPSLPHGEETIPQNTDK
jgi:phytoene desaturase